MLGDLACRKATQDIKTLLEKRHEAYMGVPLSHINTHVMQRSYNGMVLLFFFFFQSIENTGIQIRCFEGYDAQIWYGYTDTP